MNEIHQANSLRARLAVSSTLNLLGVQPEGRKIRPSRYGRLHGQHPVVKGHPPVMFESGMECRFLGRLVELKELESVRSQPVTVHFRVAGSAMPSRYTPDFQLRMFAPAVMCGLRLQRRCFVEVKPLKVALAREAELRHKFSAVQLAMGAPVVLITDADLGIPERCHG